MVNPLAMILPSLFRKRAEADKNLALIEAEFDVGSDVRRLMLDTIRMLSVNTAMSYEEAAYFFRKEIEKLVLYTDAGNDECIRELCCKLYREYAVNQPESLFEKRKVVPEDNLPKE